MGLEYNRVIMSTSNTQNQSIEIVEPIGNRVLIRKDESKKITKSGIHLPNKVSIPVDFEGDNRLFVVPIENIVAVFRRN